MSTNGRFGVLMSQKSFWDIYIAQDLGKILQRGGNATANFQEMVEEVSVRNTIFFQKGITSKRIQKVLKVLSAFKFHVV